MDNIYTDRLFETIKCYLFDVVVMFYINYLSNLEVKNVCYLLSIAEHNCFVLVSEDVL